MAIAEQEITRPLTISLSQDHRETLERAALATGQSLEGFAASALLRAADEALTSPSALVRPPARSLDSILGIFKDEPLMDALMARIHAERQAQMEQEMEAQETESQETEAVA